MFPNRVSRRFFRCARSLSVLPVLLLGSLLFLGGCGGSDQKQSTEVRGDVHTFIENARGGRVQCYTLDGTLIPDASGTVNDRGAFSIVSKTLPESFLVVVDQIVESESGVGAGSGGIPVPPTLSALVEHSGPEMSVVVTPLSTLVATYALATKKSLSDADGDIAIFLGLWPAYSPSRLLPGSEIWDFSYTVFANKLVESGLLLEAFLNSLIEDARVGKTHYCRGSGNGLDITKWALEKIKDGIGEKLADAGIGWLTSLVMGEAPDRYMERLNEISQKLDKIYGEMIKMESDIKNMLQVMLLEADYKALIDDAAIIEVLYDKLESLPKYKDRKDAARIAKDIVSDGNHTSVLVSMKKIHNIMGGTLATPTYVHLADHLVAQVHEGRMTLAGALDEYERVFRYIMGVQMKGLILATERHHSFFTNPDSVRTAVTDQLKSYTDAIKDQMDPFLNGVEKLNALFAAGDSSLQYYTEKRMPVTGDTKNYHRFDRLAGNAVGASSQVVVRFTWDARVASQYGGPGGKPEDYDTFFAFLQERMNKLANEGIGVTLYQFNGDTTFRPVVERGSLNRILNRFAGEAETETMVRRYTFRDLDIPKTGSVLHMILDEKEFLLKENEPPVAGTVGRSLNANNAGRNLFVSPNNEELQYYTIALYAWLPESYLHEGNDGWAGPMLPVFATEPVDREHYPSHEYGIRSVLNNKYFNEDEGTHLAACKGNWGEGQIRHKFLRYVPVTDKTKQRFLRYGDIFSIYADGRELAPVGPGQYYGENHIKYCPRQGCGSGWENRIRFVMRPVPTLVSRFLDPAKYAIPRQNMPVYFRNTARGKDVTVTDSGDWLWTEACECRKARFTIHTIP